MSQTIKLFNKNDNLKHYIIKKKNKFFFNKFYLYDNGNLKFSEIDGNLLKSLDDLIMTGKVSGNRIRVKDNTFNKYSKVIKKSNRYLIYDFNNEFSGEVNYKKKYELDFIEAHLLSIKLNNVYIKLVNFIPEFVKELDYFRYYSTRKNNLILFCDGIKVVEFYKIDKNTYSLIMNHKLDISNIFPLIITTFKKKLKN